MPYRNSSKESLQRAKIEEKEKKKEKGAQHTKPFGPCFCCWRKDPSPEGKQHHRE
jgi:hypothetical protein